MTFRVLTVAQLAASLLMFGACAETPNPAPPPASVSASPISTPPPTVDPIQVLGVVSVATEPFRAKKTDAKCTRTDPYPDVHTGTQVTVTDESGKVVALDTLGYGGADEIFGGYATRCNYSLVIDVPEGSQFYGIEVAHRGVTRFSRADLDEIVSLTLG